MSGRGYTAWCHFNFDAEAAPGWLKKLSDEAKLPKDNVSLSFLHFSAKGRKLAAGEGKSLVRAVSGPFELPAPDGSTAPHRFGQYACSERGLTLLSLPKKHLVPLPGTLLEAAWPDYPETDAKSHALVLPLGGDVPTPAMRPAPEGKQAHALARKPGAADRPAQAPRAFQADRPAKADDRADKFNRPAKPGASGKPGKPAQSDTPAKAMTVDSIIAAEKTGAPGAAPKRKRLPSERPADPVKPAKQAGRPARAPSGSAPAKGKADAKPKDKPHASRAERKAAGSAPGQKPTGKASGKSSGKSASASKGKPAKPKGKA